MGPEVIPFRSHQKLPETLREQTVNLIDHLKGKNTAIDPCHVQPFLLNWVDIEHWQQDNHFIHSGYRPASYSCWTSFLSLGYLHNQTVNIYSHLIPAILAMPGSILLYHVLKVRYDRATYHDLLAFACYFLGAALCLGTSSIYHMMCNHSPLVNRIGNQLDYVGIVLLITGSFIPCVYYGFWCHPLLQKVYWVMISSLGVGCTVVSIMSRFRTPAWRPFRAAMFVAMGLSAIFPVLHGLNIFGFDQMQRQMGLIWVVLQGALYIVGAGIYAARVPEKWNPGKYDIWGHSHQIFHLLVVLAAMSHLVGLLQAFDYRHGFPGAFCA